MCSGGWGVEAEQAVFVEVESVAEDVQVPHAAGGLDDLLFGLGELFSHCVVLAGVVVGAFVAGAGLLARLELFALFPHVLNVLAGGAVGLDDLFEGDGRVDLRGVLFDPVGFEGGVVPVVEWLLELGDDPDDAVEDHLAGGYAVARPDGSVFWVWFVYVGQDGCELGAVVGDFEYVVLGLAGEVGYVAIRVGDVAGLVEPCRGSVPALLLIRGLGRSEYGVQLLLEARDGATGVGSGGSGVGDV